MHSKICEKMNMIELLAKEDKQYSEMLREIRVLERRYDEILCQLPYDRQDIICDFVSLCERMSQRMLEIACTLMYFPDDQQQ